MQASLLPTLSQQIASSSGSVEFVFRNFRSSQNVFPHSRRETSFAARNRHYLRAAVFGFLLEDGMRAAFSLFPVGKTPKFPDYKLFSGRRLSTLAHLPPPAFKPELGVWTLLLHNLRAIPMEAGRECTGQLCSLRSSQECLLKAEVRRQCFHTEPVRQAQRYSPATLQCSQHLWRKPESQPTAPTNDPHADELWQLSLRYPRELRRCPRGS